MKQEQASVSEREGQMRDIYYYSPPSVLSYNAAAPEQKDEADLEQSVPAAWNMKKRLRIALETFFPRTTPLSVLFLHVAQFEQSAYVEREISLYKRHQHHVTPGLLEQILGNARRVIRQVDPVLVHKDASAALLFPDTDQWSAYSILERVYNSISLLQSETVIPPLTHETTIFLGVGTYPEPCSSLESLLDQAGSIERSFTLRPVVTTQAQVVQPAMLVGTSGPQSASMSSPAKKSFPPATPFMQLPKTLPQRLRQLLPYQVALQFRCVPVGREHRSMTIAAARPLDAENLRHLQEITGMSIFPVSCREDELSTLLASGW